MTVLDVLIGIAAGVWVVLLVALADHVHGAVLDIGRALARIGHAIRRDLVGWWLRRLGIRSPTGRHLTRKQRAELAEAWAAGARELERMRPEVEAAVAEIKSRSADPS